MTMTTIPADQLTDLFMEFFAEAYEGRERETWFTDGGPTSGLFRTLATVSAAEASAAPDGGTSIASHIGHLYWVLSLHNRVIQGEPWQPHWDESWKVSEVDEDAWTSLQAGLRSEYDQLRQVIPPNVNWNDPVIARGVMSHIPHAAYHLGAIRQLLRVIKRA